MSTIRKSWIGGPFAISSVARWNNLLACLLLIPFFVQEGQAEIVDRVVAIVNQDVITQSEVDQLLAFHVHELQSLSTPEEKTLRLRERHTEAVNKLIEQKLLAGKIDASSITVSSQELADAVKRVLSENRMSEAELRQELAKNNVSFQEFKDNLEKQLKQSKFLQSEIRPKIQLAEADLREYYNQHIDEFRSFKEVNFTQLLLPATGNRSLDAAMTLAQTLKSQGLATARKNGNVQVNESGWIATRDLNPELLHVLGTLAPKQLSGPIPTELGAFLIEVHEWRDPYTAPFAEVKTKIENTLYASKLDSALQQYVATLRQQAYVHIIN